jgi:predicted  nucleic acid-binding Zn-ribbon protein
MNNTSNKIALRQQLDALQQLQDCDSLADHAQQTLLQLPSKQQALAEELQAYRDKIGRLEQSHQELADKLRHYETQQHQQETALQRSQQRQGQIKTNEEFLAVQKEIDTLQALLSQGSEQIKQQREEVLNTRHELESTQRYLVELEATIGEKRAGLEREQQEAQQVLAGYDQGRAPLLAAVNHEGMRRTYERLRAKLPLAVVKIHQPICEACKMSLTPHLFNTLLAMQHLQQCPSCFRILNLQPIPQQSADKKENQKNLVRR